MRSGMAFQTQERLFLNQQIIMRRTMRQMADGAVFGDRRVFEHKRPFILTMAFVAQLGDARLPQAVGRPPCGLWQSEHHIFVLQKRVPGLHVDLHLQLLVAGDALIGFVIPAVAPFQCIQLFLDLTPLCLECALLAYSCS